jgi:hypothetical protein
VNDEIEADMINTVNKILIAHTRLQASHDAIPWILGEDGRGLNPDGIELGRAIRIGDEIDSCSTAAASTHPPAAQTTPLSPTEDFDQIEIRVQNEGVLMLSNSRQLSGSSGESTDDTYSERSSTNTIPEQAPGFVNQVSSALQPSEPESAVNGLVISQTGIYNRKYAARTCSRGHANSSAGQDGGSAKHSVQALLALPESWTDQQERLPRRRCNHFVGCLSKALHRRHNRLSSTHSIKLRKMGAEFSEYF